LTTFTMLTHGLTGAFCFFGIYCFAAFGPRAHRVRLLSAAVILSAVVVGLCMLWPWYDFLTVARAKPADTEHSTDWYSPGLVKLALFYWHVPAILCAASALTIRSQPIVRASLIAGGLAWSISLAGLATRTPVLGRLPIPSIFFWHLPAAVFVHQAGLLEIRRWPSRVQELVSRREDVAPRRVIELIVLGSIVWCLVPQFLEILNKPYLAREYVTYLLPGIEDKQLNLRAVYGELLRPIAEGDVVLSDDVTAWPVPAFGGRIVSAFHEELLVPGQVERRRDVEIFFASGTPIERRQQIIDRYGVKWIIINRKLTRPESMDALRNSFRTTRDVGDLVLLETADASPQ
jgi:hypothetical protein